MDRDRTRQPGRAGPTRSGRRRFLRRGAAGLAVLGASATAFSTMGFTSGTVGRGATVDVASDTDAYLGINGLGPVKKNSRESMVELTNKANADMTITVGLAVCSDGTLYDNDGDSGCSVTFPVAVGNSQVVDLEASVTGTITYSIDVASAGPTISTTRTVDAEAGNVSSAVSIKAPTMDNKFTADPRVNEFQIQNVDIRDNDGDDDLAKVEFRVTEASSGDLVGSKDVTPPGDRYKPTGNPSVTVLPDAGYTISRNTTYDLTTTGIDADGNQDATVVSDTA